MGYAGNTYLVSCKKGGLDFSVNHDFLAPTAMVEGTKNIVFAKGGRTSRGGTTKYQTATVGTPTILNTIQYTPIGGSSTQISWTDEGTILHDGVVITVPQTLTANVYCDFEIFNDELYFVNGVDEPMIYTADAWVLLSSFYTLPADWSDSNGHPAWVVAHGKGNSRRLWMGGVAKDLEKVYASEDGDAHNFTDECVYILDIETYHELGIVGAIRFNEKLIFFSRNNAYILDDESASITEWGYTQAPWEAGVAHNRLFLRTPNDIYCMTAYGEIYSIVAVQASNDYNAASLAEPVSLDIWNRENLDFNEISKFHAIYDPVNKVARFFVVRAGQSQVDTCLVNYINRDITESWMIEDNLQHPSGYNAACSAIITTSIGQQLITGDYTGNIWTLSDTTKNDDGNKYWSGFLTPNFVCDGVYAEETGYGSIDADTAVVSARYTKNAQKVILSTIAQGDFTIQSQVTVDAASLVEQAINLLGVGVPLDDFMLDDDMLVDGFEIIDNNLSVKRNFKRMTIRVYNNVVNQQFMMAKFYVDYKLLGKRG